MTRKEKIVAYIGSRNYIPLKREELATVLDVPSSDMPEFLMIIDEMIDDGLAFESKKGRLMPSNENGVLKGVFLSNEKGFGFVSVKNREKDIFIPADYSGGAMNDDVVFVKIMSTETDQKRAEGKVVKVVERNTKTLVCSLKKRFKGYEAFPDNKRYSKSIRIALADLMGARRGQKVVVEIIKYPTADRHAEGRVVEILGYESAPGTILKSVIRTFDIKDEFPADVIKETKLIPEQIAESDLAGRRDLRDKIIFTIDGEDAKDLDDAVSLEKKDDGNYLLGVHIADVSHYVKKGSAIEREAIERGTSIYLAGGVIPMLPPRLSNGICSLNHGMDRLTLSIEMTITPDGEIVDHEIFEAVIKTTERTSYEEITKVLGRDAKLLGKYEKILPMIKEMEKLARVLRNKRIAEGSIDFNFPETKLIFDDDGKVIDIKKYEYTIANSIIEEFMLAANRTVAEHFFWLGIPFVFRNHEKPSKEKMEVFFNLASVFGIVLKDKPDNVHSLTLQKVLEQVKGEAIQDVISHTMLKSMMKAQYSTENIGHFGLGANYYCHFTSPIRRLADLAIHRIIKSVIKGERTDFSAFAEIAAQNATAREVVAEEAENQSKKIKIADFMHQYVGYEFDAKIVSILPNAFFVELENSVQGRVALSDLEDYYEYNERSMSLVSPGKEYKIGDNIQVVLVRADVTSGELDFLPEDEL